MLYTSRLLKHKSKDKGKAKVNENIDDKVEKPIIAENLEAREPTCRKGSNQAVR